MKIAAVILNWCDARATLRCVSSLKMAGFKGTIYVVDNASPDLSYQELRKKLPDCIVLRNTVNSGYTGGNNYGIRIAFEADHDLAVILNNDVEVRLSAGFWCWLEGIASSTAKALIGIPVGNSERSEQLAFPAAHGRVTSAIVSGAELPHTSFPELLCGCAMAITRELYEKTGPLDEALFMYCEEFDYSIRCVKSGGELFYAPPSLGFVLRRGMSASRPAYVYYYQARNLIILTLQHLSKARVRTVALVTLVSLKNAFVTRQPSCLRAAIIGIAHGLGRRGGRFEGVHRPMSK